MTRRTDLCPALADLLEYPTEDYPRRVAAARALLGAENPPAANLLEDFARRIAGQSPQELEELFTRTFDINPICCLEVGWHLYGDNYDRGEFLVRMRGHLRELGLEEGQELPDHLAHVLPIIGRLPEEQSADLTSKAALPAVDKMLAGMADKQSPYEQVLRAVREVLTTMHPACTRSAT